MGKHIRGLGISGGLLDLGGGGEGKWKKGNFIEEKHMFRGTWKRKKSYQAPTRTL